jgi:hypothetical protein
MKLEMETYTADVFQGYVGRTMTFEQTANGASRRRQLELVEIRRSPLSSRPEGFREPFTLLFVVNGTDLPGNGLHRLLHDDFGPTEWLLTRVTMPGRDSATPYFEAVFG